MPKATVPTRPARRKASARAGPRTTRPRAPVSRPPQEATAPVPQQVAPPQPVLAAVPVGAAPPKEPVQEPVWLVRIVLLLFLVGFAAFLAREVYNFVQALG